MEVRRRGNRRVRRMEMRLSDQEAAALDRCADRWGLSYSDLVRMWIKQDEREAMEDGVAE